MDAILLLREFLIRDPWFNDVLRIEDFKALLNGKLTFLNVSF